jgi:hypothetical protein
MLVSKPSKVQYSEIEAAEILGVTVEQLRSLIQSHIVKDESDAPTTAVSTFQSSDLLVLRILSRKQFSGDSPTA